MLNRNQNEQHAGQIYRSLPDERGERTDLVTQGDEVTTKQSAEDETGKARQTLNRWAKEAEIMLLDIEARIGELSLAIPSEPAWHKDKDGHPQRGGEKQKHEKMGMSRAKKERAQVIYNNPEAVAEVIKEAEENEDIRTPVLPFGESWSLPLGNSIGITLSVTPLTETTREYYTDYYSRVCGIGGQYGNGNQ